MQKMYKIMNTYLTTQISDTLANVIERFLKNSFEVSFIKLEKRLLKYVHEEKNACSGNVILQEASQNSPNPHAEDLFIYLSM